MAPINIPIQRQTRKGDKYDCLLHFCLLVLKPFINENCILLMWKKA